MSRPGEMLRQAGGGPGRKASQPPLGWQPPRHRVPHDPAVVTFVEEGTGRTTVFDLSGLPLPEPMRVWLAEVLARAVGPRSGVKRVTSATVKYQLIVRLAETLKTAAPSGPDEFMASHVKRFRLAHQNKPVGRAYLKGLRELLRDDRRLPAPARAELFGEPLPKPRPAAPLAAYTEDQWHRLMSLLRGDIRRARDRIRAGRELLAAYRDGQLAPGSEDFALGEVLDAIDRTGDVPRFAGGKPKPQTRRPGDGHAGHHLCLAPFEATAFCLYLVALTGVNFGTVAGWPAAHLRPDGGTGPDALALLEAQKPRRGPDREHLVLAVEDHVPPELAEILTSEGDARLMRSPLQIYQLLLDLTELSRRHGQHERAFGCLALNQPTSRRWSIDLGVKSRYPDLWAIKHGYTTDPGCAIPPVDVRRLRQSVIERTRRPAAHTAATMNDRYLARSPVVAADSRTVVGDALRDQVHKALAVQQISVLPPSWADQARRDPEAAAHMAGLDPATAAGLASGALDTVATACTDHTHSPFTEPGSPCTTSFLDCLSCPNARALPHHLSIQIGLRDRLAGLRPHPSRPDSHHHRKARSEPQHVAQQGESGMSRRPRDRDAEAAAVSAAGQRLLAGTPLRSASGRLTVTELITESGLARDKVYDHKALVEQFQAQALAQHQTPAAMQALQDKHRDLTAKLAQTSADLARERDRNRQLRLHIAELSLEFDQAREQLESASKATRLRIARTSVPQTHKSGISVRSWR